MKADAKFKITCSKLSDFLPNCPIQSAFRQVKINSDVLMQKIFYKPAKYIHWPAKLLHGQGVTLRFDIFASIWQTPSELILFG